MESPERTKTAAAVRAQVTVTGGVVDSLKDYTHRQEKQVKVTSPLQRATLWGELHLGQCGGSKNNLGGRKWTEKKVVG